MALSKHLPLLNSGWSLLSQSLYLSLFPTVQEEKENEQRLIPAFPYINSYLRGSNPTTTQNLTLSKMPSLQTHSQTQTQTHVFLLEDSLYCQENCFHNDQNEVGFSDFDDDGCSPEDEEEQLLALFSKEQKIAQCSAAELDCNEPFMAARKQSLEWMKRVRNHIGFSASTLVLGVNYFDRFMMGSGDGLPWMTQLAAIACLSLASKIHESRAHHTFLLEDFQVDCEYTFEAKTIQRMELLVLSTLEWEMNAVTPFSFFGYLLKRLDLRTHHHLHEEILSRFETLILSAIFDWRYLCYTPSVLAAATLVQALKQLDLWSVLGHSIQRIHLSKINKEKMEECHKFIQEVSRNNSTLKRKYINSTSSPNNVLDILSLTEESSKESSITSLLPSSPEPLSKKRLV